MDKYAQPARFKRSRSSMLLTAAILAAVLAPQAHAFNFDLTDEVSGNLDFTVGYANLFRTEDSQRTDWISQGGRYGGFNDLSERRVPNKWDLVSQVYSVTTELGLNRDNYGLVAAAAFKYDTEIMDRGMDRGDLAGTGVRWSDETREYAGNSVDLLDAYVWGSFMVGENPLEVRVGKQVINWGEGLYFLNGVSSQVPLNFNKLAIPGSELKEAYIGNNAIFANYSIGDTSSIEAYYQLEWNRAEYAPQGTWFGVDVLYRGAREADGFNNLARIVGIDAATQDALGWSNLPLRLADQPAKNSGQWGVNYKTTIGDVEYGLYYSRYHDTRPYFYGDFTANQTGFGQLFFDFGQTYVENQDMFGASWSTTLGNWSFAGEVAYRPDQALQMDAFGKGVLSEGLRGTSYQKNDTINASVNGIWLGGPTLFGIDSQYALYQLGIDHISGDRSNLAVQGTITRTSELEPLPASIIPDKTSAGVALNWGGTWNNVVTGTNVTLDVFVQQGLFGNSHFYGNFAENQTIFATSLIANIGTDIEASLTYSGMIQKDSDYEDQDTIGLAINYKF